MVFFFVALRNTDMQTIYFLPRYIGALKYYEQLFPALRAAGFAPTFLLFDDSGMVAYCRSRALPVDTTFIMHTPRFHVPFVTPVRRDLARLNRIDSFLTEKKPHVLVCEPAVPQLIRALYKVARARGIRTLALQWASHSDAATQLGRTVRSRLLALRDHGIILSIYLFILKGVFYCVDLLLGRNKLIQTELQVDSLGVVDSAAKEYFIRTGWQGGRVSVVGLADFTLMRELSHNVAINTTARALLEKKYKLVPGKKRVLVLSTPFYTGARAVYLSNAGQQEYFGNVFEDIRAVFGVAEADIIFKLHPREQNIYGDLSDMGVHVCHNEADLTELIALSDLYIAHPGSGANFVVRASGKPALFINFTPLLYMDVGKELYQLRSIVKTHEDFRAQLATYKAGTLPLQYDASQVDYHSLQKIVDFISERETQI